ncbi:pro-FMRFamide-related neuropeptide VF isoform X1 [Erinaceus europaeus]|uniref:Pro-FMRFamide-related neuropeptide VF n=1 Tax=Erinaceus europaeus TaxID=9365 RepID=A0ABM3XS92_ERIEU|nr:pro-FMRFamide-related neuropeptide VF isoform X1 [Erinaceus europaeus]
MKLISPKRLILLTLATSSFLTSNTFCAEELMMSSLHSKENYDKYTKPTGNPRGEKERSLNFKELKDWGPKNAIKISTPAANKMPHSAASLPLRFGRTTGEERSTGEMVSLPLKFGRYMKESISRRVPNLPQRFGRMTQSVTKTPSDLFQQSMYHSPSANVLICPMISHPQETQIPRQKYPRRLEFKNIHDVELKPEK